MHPSAIGRHGEVLADLEQVVVGLDGVETGPDRTMIIESDDSLTIWPVSRTTPTRSVEQLLADLR